MAFDRYAYWRNYEKLNAGRWELKRTPLKKKPLKIKKVSASRAKALREYEKVKAEFLKDKVCEYPGCESEEVTCHHSAGRIGKRLTDVATFRALCEYHHRHCELHPIEAKELGLSIDRLST